MQGIKKRTFLLLLLLLCVFITSAYPVLILCLPCGYPRLILWLSSAYPRVIVSTSSRHPRVIVSIRWKNKMHLKKLFFRKKRRNVWLYEKYVVTLREFSQGVCLCGRYK